jgi:hypothetical protein
MKRRALLIGNTHGLEGVKVDLIAFQEFLKSDRGGAWYPSEIEAKPDIAKKDLETLISNYKNDKHDYVIVMFSGHGGQTRETVLELNKNQETISETELRNLSDRQLNIYDCCRAYASYTADSLMRMKAAFESISKSVSSREKYDRRIMQAIPQQILLYSCSIGQLSYDSPRGGVYLQNLLRSTLTIGGDFKLVGVAHQEAKALTEAQVRKEHQKDQHPEGIIPKCLSDQQLVFAINV